MAARWIPISSANLEELNPLFLIISMIRSIIKPVVYRVFAVILSVFYRQKRVYINSIQRYTTFFYSTTSDTFLFIYKCISKYT